MNNKYRDIIKAVLFTFILNLLLVIVMLLYANNDISDVLSLVLTLGVLVVFGSLFSVIKGKMVRYLQYNIVSIVSHIVFIILTLLIMGCIYKGWETAMFLWMEKFSLISYLIFIVIDSIACFVNNKLSK